uniref:uncharacterized protein LOC122590135 n=1 Tax=Erigeron canadensis TaxID=72917 RepID=UPI001CB8ED0B|nr:uncharacterized protein LOC122590135 [Erigeron canadensis]
MDVNKTARNGYRWTNDKHLRFLKSVEASFVKTMMANGDSRNLPMDRDVPDSCESTLDAKEMTSTKRRKRHFSTDTLEASISIDRKVRRLSEFHPSSHDDQVVPQIKHLKTEDDDQNWTSSP